MMIENPLGTLKSLDLEFSNKGERGVKIFFAVVVRSHVAQFCVWSADPQFTAEPARLLWSGATADQEKLGEINQAMLEDDQLCWLFNSASKLGMPTDIARDFFLGDM